MNSLDSNVKSLPKAFSVLDTVATVVLKEVISGKYELV
jgi:hypothetical protein